MADIALIWQVLHDLRVVHSKPQDLCNGKGFILRKEHFLALIAPEALLLVGKEIFQEVGRHTRHRRQLPFDFHRAETTAKTLL